MDPDQKPIDIQTFPCPDKLCTSRPFKRQYQLLVHLKDVHDRKIQLGKEPSGNRRKRRLSGFSTGNGLEHVSSTKEDADIFQGCQKIRDKRPEIISWQSAVGTPEALDPVDLNHGFDELSSFWIDPMGCDEWSHTFGELPSIQTDPVGSMNEFASSLSTGPTWPLVDKSTVCLEEPFKSLPQHNLLNPVVEDQQDAYLGSMMHGERAEMNGLTGESDDLTKSKMISALQKKYAELKQVDEEIRKLEELKANRSNITKDIAGLVGHYLDFVQGAHHCI